MTSLPPILALFLDEADRKVWASLLEALPAELTCLTIGGIPAAPRSLLSLSPRPCITLVSARLYPSPAMDLVSELQRVVPGLEVVVLATANEPQMPVRPLLVGGVRHLAVVDPSREPDQAHAVIFNLLNRQPWDLAAYLQPSAQFLELPHISPCRKEEVLERIENLLNGPEEDLDLLRQRAVLLADEMLENAFCASQTNRLNANANITLRAGFDGESLALQVVDRQGLLYPEDALSVLARHQDGMVPLDQPHGRGLFIIWRFLDHFHVNIRPGMETVIGGLLRRSSSLSPELAKGFHFFVQSPRLDFCTI